MTDPDADLQEVIDFELSLLQPEVRSNPDAVLGLLHSDFREFGASGRVWDRTAISAALADDPGSGAEAEDIRTVRLAPDAMLLTYLARTPKRVSLRSSVWVRNHGRWQLLFHQGTACP